MDTAKQLGPLSGLTVIELAGIGPVPFAGMLLADMGADVIRIDRVGKGAHAWDTNELRHTGINLRGKRSLSIDLRDSRGVEIIMRLIERSDILLEGMRPGVAERLGLGPEACFERRPELVYGRMTGWGQDGPQASAAGHDINYLALSGVLNGIGRPDSPPTPPLSLVGDFGGGSMFLLFGVMSALYEARNSGRGQVVDSAMIEGAALLNTSNYSMLASGTSSIERGEHMLSGAAPHYDAYECSDGRWVTIAAIEPQFYQELLSALELSGDLWEGQHDRSKWPARKKKLSRLFRQHDVHEWTARLQHREVCFAPMLDPVEAASHPHNVHRQNFQIRDGVLQPAPAPKLSQTPATIRSSPPLIGEHTAEILRELGYHNDELSDLEGSAVIGIHQPDN